MRIYGKRVLVLNMVVAVLVATCCLPMNVVHAQPGEQIRNVSVTKIVDTPLCRVTLYEIETNEKTYHIIVRANITTIGTETYVSLNATLYNPHNASITADAQIPDTLTAPYYSGSVEAFHISFPKLAVDALKIALPVIIAVALVIQLFDIIEDFIEAPLRSFIQTMIGGGPTIYASFPWILLTLLNIDTNPDGTFDLYIPFMPILLHFGFLLQHYYYLATNMSWWKIAEHEVYTDVWIFHIVWFTYWDATWIQSRGTDHPIPLPPTASFYWMPMQPIVGETVIFTSTSFDPDNGSIQTYNWSLGDQDQSTEKNFTHIYGNAGDYTVVLNVTDSDDNLTDSCNRTITVLLVQARLRVIPDYLQLNVSRGQSSSVEFFVGESLSVLDLLGVAIHATDFTRSDAGTTFPGTVDFDKNGITIPKGNFTNVTATFNAPADSPVGWFSGNITITSENGGNATSLVHLLVYAQPTANFTWSPAIPVVGQPVILNASSSESNGNPIASYSWNFGDGGVTTVNDSAVIYVYNTTGIYNVTLTVKDTADLNDTTSKLVQVFQHDVAVVAVTPNRPWVYQGMQTPVNVTITNYGDFNETVTVKLYYNITSGQLVGTKVVDLAPSKSEILTFGWNTTHVQYCHNYTITAVAEIEFDSNITNNQLDSSLKVKVRIPGDVNGDSRVDILDAIIAANSFSSYPGHPVWNEAADINEDQIINILDMILISNNFGKKC